MFPLEPEDRAPLASGSGGCCSLRPQRSCWRSGLVGRRREGRLALASVAVGTVLTSLAPGVSTRPGRSRFRRTGSVAAGESHAKGSENFALVRYTTNGKLDASFGSDGKVLTSFAT